MTVLTFDDVTKRFKGVDLLEGVSLSIEEGITYGLVGPNGSGKSVAMLMMCGLMSPTSGSVSIDPTYLAKGRTFPDRFGIAINGPSFLGGLSALDNLKDLARIRKRATTQECEMMLDAVGLDPRSPLPARRFSLGMKQKLSLAQAFIEEPEVLLLDEPFNALDERSVAVVGDLLRDFQGRGRTIVLTSHNASDIDEYSERVLKVVNRRIEEVR